MECFRRGVHSFAIFIGIERKWKKIVRNHLYTKQKKPKKIIFGCVCVYVYYIFGMNEWSNKLTSDQKLKNE